MKIAELFERRVTRDIPPVVYFHESTPEKLNDEVSEYIITGGYKPTDPRAKRVGRGIHEEFVHLLDMMHAERQKKSEHMPASWISGFYGSGKSSFAKLLGYALDGRVLPNGEQLSEALLRRDDSSRHDEFREAWRAFTSGLKPLAVVFDIGGVARDNEHIHSAVVRQMQLRLGYCSTSNLVAEHELKLERDGEWAAFLKTAEATLKRPWSEVKDSQQADYHFSHVLHALRSDRYVEPMSWLYAKDGSSHATVQAVTEAVGAIQAMIEHRAPDHSVFFVVDEVSQYVHDNEDRMLKLQSFVMELAQRLKGNAWLLVTGQQKLDDSGNTVVLSKLRDRFPERLRVHLGTTNIRDVVHRRLLKKSSDHVPALEALFQQYRSELKVYAYECTGISQEDFVEVYPMLPGQIDLLLNITTSLRSRSTRVQGDTHQIRGLLQLLGELFREQKLADAEVGRLITVDAIFDVLHTALEEDVQATLGRLFEHCAARNDEIGRRAAKAVALLELVQEQKPTTAELVAQCLYERLGQGSQVDAIAAALEGLRGAGHLGYSEKTGYKIQSSSGQEWQRDRDDIPAGNEHLTPLVREALDSLLDNVPKAALGQVDLPWVGFFSDERYVNDARLKGSRDDTNVPVDFRYVSEERRRSPDWARRSAEPGLSGRILWVASDAGRTTDLARHLVKSRGMVARFKDRRESLGREKQRLLLEEQQRIGDLEAALRQSVAEAFHAGDVYFRGRSIPPRDDGNSFPLALNNIAKRLLPELYPHFMDVAITPSDLSQLLSPELSGPSTRLLPEGLGILSQDAGRYQATCDGLVPSSIFAELEREKGMSGASLLSTFGQPPYGYAKEMVHASVAGLLRGGKVRLQPDGGPVITSVRDPGAVEVFMDRAFKRANIFPSTDESVGPRDRAAICKLFDQLFGTTLERSNDAIADAVFQYVLPRRESLRRVEIALSQLGGPPRMPAALDRLVRALEQCGRDRQVEPTVKAVKAQLDVLRDGLELLAIYENDLTPDAIARVRRASDVRDHYLSQLVTHGAAADYTDAKATLERQLGQERPWAGIRDLETLLDSLVQQYRAVRGTILGEQEKSAEAARGQVKRRAGFETLAADEVHHVLRPLTEVIADADPQAKYPAIGDLHDKFAVRLQAALEDAHERLDQALSKASAQPVVTVDARLRGREVGSTEELEALLAELRERILRELGQKRRVRLL